MSVLAAMAARRSWRKPIIPPPPGDYSSERRYKPRYTLPNRYADDGTNLGALTYNELTGLVEGRVFEPRDPGTWAVEELLTQQGSPALNQALLQARIDAHAATVGNVRLGLQIYDGSAVRVSWGVNGLRIGARARTGVGLLSIESEKVKAGTFPRAAWERFRPGDEPHTAFFGFNPTGGGEAASTPMFWLTPGVSNVRFLGLEFGFDPAWAGNVWNTGSTTGGRGFIFTGIKVIGGPRIATGVDADYPYRITVDRCSIHGEEGLAWGRGAVLNGKFIAVINNHFRDIARKGIDSQCISATSGSGPYLLHNNHFGCAFGENVMFGGEGSGSETEVMSDIQITNNFLEWPAAWQVYGIGTKNLLEFKEGKRAIVQGNRFHDYNIENKTPYASQRYALSVKLNIDDGDGAPWGETRDITIRCNSFTDCGGLLTLVDQDNYFGKDPINATNRVEFAHNVLGIYKDGTQRTGQYERLIQFSTGSMNRDEQTRLRSVYIHHNTLFGPYSANSYQCVFFQSGDPTAPFTDIHVYGNAILIPDAAPNKNGYLRFGSSNGTRTARANWEIMDNNIGSTWGFNAIAGVTSATHLIVGDIGHADIAAMGVDTATGAPQTGSPLLTADLDGGLIGADFNLMLAATAGAEDVL